MTERQSALSQLEEVLKIGDLFQIEDTEGSPYRFIFVSANAQTLFLRHPDTGNIYRVHFRHFNLKTIQLLSVRPVLFPEDPILITSRRGNEHEGLFVSEYNGIISMRLPNLVEGKVAKANLDPSRCYLLYETQKPQVFDLIQTASLSGNRYRGYLLEVSRDSMLVRTLDNKTGKLIFNRLKGPPKVLIPIADPRAMDRWFGGTPS